MKIGTWISGSQSTGVLIIAEGGVNHDGSPAIAHRLIDVAHEAGADVIKFQIFDPDSLAAENAPLAEYQRSSVSGSTQRDMLAALALPRDSWSDLAEHAAHIGLAFMATAFDTRSLARLLSLGVPALKIPSGELTNLGFIEEHARTGLPLVMSTGMSSMTEVEAAVRTARGARPDCELAVLHCVSAYPAPLSELNLRAIPTLSQALGITVGYSDHSLGSIAGVGAVALGARLVEKHLTLDRTRSGPDHAASADPEGFAQFVSDIRSASQALGDGVKRVAASEEAVRLVARRSWHATHDLAMGSLLAGTDIVALRPLAGIPVDTEVVGLRLVESVRAGEAIQRHQLAWREGG